MGLVGTGLKSRLGSCLSSSYQPRYHESLGQTGRTRFHLFEKHKVSGHLHETLPFIGEPCRLIGQFLSCDPCDVIFGQLSCSVIHNILNYLRIPFVWI